MKPTQAPNITEDHLMAEMRRYATTIAASLALAGCTTPTQQAKGSVMQDASVAPRSNRIPVKQWPLKFDSHKFSVKCYDTYGCTVEYAGLQQWADEPDEYRPSSASYGPDYQRNWGGIHGMIRNFPHPAKVNWRSKDGQAHETEIDFGKIFADEVIRHNVSRGEMSDVQDGEYQGEPSIILEINDRTIRIWMRAMIFLKREVEVAGVMRADFKNDLVLVKTYTY